MIHLYEYHYSNIEITTVLYITPIQLTGTSNIIVNVEKGYTNSNIAIQLPEDQLRNLYTRLKEFFEDLP